MGQVLETNYNNLYYIEWLENEHKYLFTELQYYKNLYKQQQQLLEKTLKQLNKERKKHVK